MSKKYEHLLNLDEQRILCLGGIPGAGKSTIARDFQNAGYEIVCPDTYRGVISRTIPGREHWTDSEHEGDQTVSARAWDMAHREAVELLKAGKSIVFDALLHTQKARRRLFAQLDKSKVPYFSLYVDTTFKTALERNSKREADGGRAVPDFVIHDKWRTQVLPSVREGFKETVVVSELNESFKKSEEEREEFLKKVVENTRETIFEMMENDSLRKWLPSLYASWGISQDNHHHSLDLHEHMITAAEKIEERNPEMVISALLHDVGKRNTKEFFVKVIAENDYFKKGEKLVVIKPHSLGVTVEKRTFNGISNVFLTNDLFEFDENAHFYNHETVGAFDARRDLLNLGFNEEFADSVYTNILYHMDLPYRPASNKHFKTLMRKVGNEGIMKLLSIRKADKMAGSLKPEFFEIHSDMIEQIKNIIRGGK